eukprot:1188761-Prorocentrum_minimum.AAC.4
MAVVNASLTPDLGEKGATLEAIKYSRGSLELLDQRKLPTQTVYLPVPDTKAAWCDAYMMCSWLAPRGYGLLNLLHHMSRCVPLQSHGRSTRGD